MAYSAIREVTDEGVEFLNEKLERDGWLRQHRITVKVGPMKSIQFEGEDKGKKRQTYYVVDGMHRITRQQRYGGMIRGVFTPMIPAEVYNSRLPLRLCISFAVGT